MGNVESTRPPRPPQRPSLSKAPPPTIPFTANDAPFNSAIKVVTPPTIVAPINNAIHQVPPRPSQGVRRPPLKNTPIRNGLKVVTSPRRPPRPAQEVQRPVNVAQKIPESSQALKVVKSPSTSETIFRGQIANKHPGKHHKAKKHHHKPTTTTILETEKVTTEATETETTPFVTEPAATTPSTTVPVQAVTEKLPESDEVVDLKTADVADNLHHLHPGKRFVNCCLDHQGLGFEEMASI